jgi:hypothetical protein
VQDAVHALDSGRLWFMTREKSEDNNLVDIGGFDIALMEQLALDKLLAASYQKVTFR